MDKMNLLYRIIGCCLFLLLGLGVLITIASYLGFAFLIFTQPVAWIALIFFLLVSTLIAKLRGSSKKISTSINEGASDEDTSILLPNSEPEVPLSDFDTTYRPPNLREPTSAFEPKGFPPSNDLTRNKNNREEPLNLDFEVPYSHDDAYKPPDELVQRSGTPSHIKTIPVYDPKSCVPFVDDIKGVTSTEPNSAEKTEDSFAVPRADLVGDLPEENEEQKQKSAVGQGVQPGGPAIEGQRKLRSRYEPVRDPKLREAAIRIHGRDCCVCGFNFDDFFGVNLGSGYVEMHHLKTIAAGERLTDPATDLAPLCANCHAMADRLARIMKPPPDTIDSLKSVLLAHLKQRLNPC